MIIARRFIAGVQDNSLHSSPVGAAEVSAAGNASPFGNDLPSLRDWVLAGHTNPGDKSPGYYHNVPTGRQQQQNGNHYLFKAG